MKLEIKFNLRKVKFLLNFINQLSKIATLINAVKEIKVDIPIVIRLEGTNAKEAGVLLNKSKMNFEVATTLEDAANKVTAVLTK